MIASASQQRAIEARRARAPKVRARQVPASRYPSAQERALAASLTRYLADMGAAVRALAPALLARVRAQRGELGRADADDPTPEEIARRLANAARGSEETSARHARAIAAYQRAELTRQLEAGIGVDLTTGDERVVAMVDRFAAENAALIRSVASNVAARIGRIVAAGATSGQSIEDIAAAIEAAAEIPAASAAALARDQVGKLYGAVTQARHQELGIDEYDWVTRDDDRVRGRPGGRYPNARPSHWARHLRRFNWGRAPEGGHPGIAPGCRCAARPVVAQALARAQAEQVEAVGAGAEIGAPTPEGAINQIGVTRQREVPHRTIEVVSQPARPIASIGLDPIAEDPTAAYDPGQPFGPSADDPDGVAEVLRIIRSGPGLVALDVVPGTGGNTLRDPATGRVFTPRVLRAATEIQHGLEYEAATRAAEAKRAPGLIGRALAKVGSLFRRRRKR